MHNGSEAKECEPSSVMNQIYFGHKDYYSKARTAANLQQEIDNGNLVIVQENGHMIKSEHVGVNYFKNKFQRVEYTI